MFGRENVNGVAAHPELTSGKLHVIALVLHAHQLGDQVALPELVAAAQCHHHLVVGLGLTDTVNGRHSGDDHHIAPLQHAFGTTQAHLLDVLVDGRVFLNEQVALRHIGLGLVIVVITHKVFDCIFWEKLAKLAVQLCCQGFIGSKHDGRSSQTGNHIGHGEGLARAGDAQQGLEHLTVQNAGDQLVDSCGLVARRRIGLIQLKGGTRISHENSRQWRRGDLRWQDIRGTG